MIYESAGSICAGSTLLCTVHRLYRSIKDQTFATLCVVIRCILYQVAGKVLCMCRDVWGALGHSMTSVCVIDFSMGDVLTS